MKQFDFDVFYYHKTLDLMRIFNMGFNKDLFENTTREIIQSIGDQLANEDYYD